MKRIISLITILCLTTTTTFAYETTQANYPNSAEPYVNALGAIVIDATNGRILYAKDINQKLPMASTTKIMTTLLALEENNLDEQFVVDSKAILVEGSSMGLLEGDIVDLRTLAYGMMLPSGNDAANVTAVHLAGSKETFCDMMNEKAQELSMFDTHFVTPSGLDNDLHYSTAYDMAILTREALFNKDFKEICKNSSAKVEFGNPPYPRRLYNYNRLIDMYDGCIGIKTGYTDSAQRCLVSAAQKNGITLIAITLNCSNDFQAHSMLYDYFFERLSNVSLKSEIGDLYIPVMGINKYIKAEPINTPTAALYLHETKDLKISMNVKPMLFAPVEIGDYLGDVVVKSGDITIYETPLYSQEYIQSPQETLNLWDSFCDKLKSFRKR